ncbi:endonuclease domain-containing protein [Rhizobium rosettiformans]|uniref:endonuclease domain-containing protein n=1 Tax=Rhizobium rosettiformans TaxID=1368430 RepID=UPI00285AB08E|nr:endonuclease domain-containing protein [Rhizobium rosettiformans]MDR7028815.1 very-short-patch-repair endonuclease [Rhizobium rosettiformans]MDR7063903.1 very-short-patch-repair endonuclease [Rhizobium rosettiformans]
MPKPPTSMDRFRRGNARRLRSTSTDAERKLWRHLWRIPIDGSHFRRQVPIGPYFADFACHQIGLIIELDGSQHATDEGLERDQERTAFLEAQGYKVIRFWNAEVLTELDAVLDTIYAAAREREIFLELHPDVRSPRRADRPPAFDTSKGDKRLPSDHPTPELRSDPPPQGEGG